MLGIGIFLSPVEMARSVSAPIFFLSWILVGIIVLGGALAYAELGVRFPKAGGDYVFHREVFGPSVAFATGWTLFAAIFSGSIAAVAVALCQYQLSTLTGWDLNAALLGPINGAQFLGALVILLLTLLNLRGLKLSARFQQFAILIPIALLFLLALFAIAFGPERATAAPRVLPLSLKGLIAAYLAAYFAYSGWNAIIYVAGEVDKPKLNLPRALLGGTLLVSLLYLVMNSAFVEVLGMRGLAEAGEAGSALALALGGPGMRQAMNFLILTCLLATLNSSILGGARVVYAMALDGVFLRRAGHLDPKTGAPSFALWLQAGWSIILILSNRFEALLLAVSLAMIITGSLTVLAYFLLGESRAPQGWRRLLLPWLPGLYLLASLVVISAQLVESFRGDSSSLSPLLGLAVIFTAYLFHAAWRRHFSLANQR